MTVQEQEKLREQYIYEKSLYERYGSRSIITFEEWIEIKKHKIMTREEEIRNAIDAIFPIPPFEKGRKHEQALMATGFEGGVKWADANPKSPWISVKDDLPCNHKELIRKNGSSTKRVIIVEDGGYYFDRMILSNNKWDWVYAIIPSYWFPIPEPPKE